MSMLSQAMTALPYPMPTAYNNGNFQGITANYAPGNAATARAGANANALPGGAGVDSALSAGMGNMYAAGALEPQSEQGKIAQWNLQNQVNQNSFVQANAANNALGQAIGNVAGTIGGYALGGLGNSLNTPGTGTIPIYNAIGG